MTGTHVHTAVAMDTTVSIHIAGDDDHAAATRALEWFHRIESICSRFDPASEVQRLAKSPGVPCTVSDVLLQTTRFAVALARETQGAFDPTIGRRMELRGFDREYRTEQRIATQIDDESASYRDVTVDVEQGTITLYRPLLLDLGAVAKGFAIDMAARELQHLRDFVIDAGGDLYLAGANEHGEPWSAGIRHPRRDGEIIDAVLVSNAAVCTSGDYLRGTPAGHHILDPSTGAPARSLASATVIAPLAMVADGLATAAFVLGAERGLALLERHGVQGVLVTPDLEIFRTREP